MILMFHGTDGYRIAQHVRQGGGTPSEGPLDDALKAMSLFDGHRTVAVGQAHLIDGLADTLTAAGVKERSDLTVILACVTAAKETKQAGANLKALKALADRCEAVQPLAGQERTEWAVAFCAQRGVALEADAARETLRRVGPQDDAGLLAGELEKLCAYCSDGTIGVAAVRELVPVPSTEVGWALSNAVRARDKRTALRLLHESLRQGQEPHKLISADAAVGIRKAREGKDDAHLAAAHAALADLDRAAKDGRMDPVDGLYAWILDL